MASINKCDIDMKKLAEIIYGNQIAKVKAKMDSVHNLLVGKKHVQFAAEVETFEPTEDY